MKKTLISLALMAACVSTSNAQVNNAFPWDFPQGIKLEAEPEQWVLSCYTMYPHAIEENKDLKDQTLIFYSTKMTEVGAEKSTVDRDVVMPNALIIPLDKNAKAKKGDILLTWWQGGSGLQRAIVKDASNPAEPIVDFLDLKYDESKPTSSMAIKYGNKQLEPGSFTVLKDNTWEPGAQIAINEDGKWLCGILIHEAEGKVLALGFADQIRAYKKENCRLIPFNEKIKKGDQVYAKWVSRYREGYKVTKVDTKIGRVWVEKDGDEETLSIAEVTKVLQ